MILVLSKLYLGDFVTRFALVGEVLLLLSLEVLAGRLGANGGPSGRSFAFGRFEGPRSGGHGKLHGRALLLKPHADGHQLFCCWLFTQDIRQ